MPEEKNNEGRPTAYKEEFNERAFRFCLLGATDEFLAECLGVCVATLYNWKRDYPKFLEAINRGKHDADARVAEALFNKSLGYDKDGKHYPADTAAMNIWLKNRTTLSKHNSLVWKDKQEVENTHTFTGAAKIEFGDTSKKDEKENE